MSIKQTTKMCSLIIVLGFLSACASTKSQPTSMPRGVSLPYTSLIAGYSYLQEVSGPGVTRHIKWVYTGLENNLHRWDLFRNFGSGDEPWQTQWFNKEGASIKFSQANNSALWEPHNCFRVVGDCEFSYTNFYGSAKNYKRVGRYNGKTWSYKLFRAEPSNTDLVSSGEVRFNRNGVVVYHEYFTQNNGHQLSQLKKVY
jgi:hypothetical protein